MRTGIVLGAGGLPGDAFHRGTLAALRDAWGLDARHADVVVGTSAGAMTLAGLRLNGESVVTSAPAPVPCHRRSRYLPGLPGRVRPELLADWLAPVLPDLRGLAGYAVRPWQLRPGRLAAALLPPGRHDTDVLTAPLERRFAGRWPRERSWVVAVRRRDGRRVVFGRDDVPADLPTAVAASCAVPGFFRPVRIGGEEYVDGFVHSATNADVLAPEALDLVVVSAPMGVHLPGAASVADLPLRLIWHLALRLEVAALRRAGSRVVVVEPAGELLGLLGLNPTHAMNIDEIEERAYERTLRRLADRPLETLVA